MNGPLTYHVGIGADGKPLVTVSSDDPDRAARAIPWVRATYAHLASSGVAPSPIQQHTEAASEQAPICGIHHIAMVGVTGRRGFFWSCHERNPDGSWCTYRPARA